MIPLRFSRYFITGVLLINLSSAAVRNANTEDDATALEWEEESFYNEDASVVMGSTTERLVAELSSAQSRILRHYKRQGTAGGSTTSDTSENVNAAAGLPSQTTQVTNITDNPYNSTENTTNGYQPGLVGNQANPNNDKVDCNQPQTGRSNDCWAQLGLTEYVIEWVNTHECYRGEGFSTCYLRQNGFPSLDCSGIAISSCPPPQDSALSLDPQKFYVAYNIHGEKRTYCFCQPEADITKL